MMQFKQFQVDPQKSAMDGLEHEDYKRVKRVRKPWIPLAKPDRSDEPKNHPGRFLTS